MRVGEVQVFEIDRGVVRYTWFALVIGLVVALAVAVVAWRGGFSSGSDCSAQDDGLLFGLSLAAFIACIAGGGGYLIFRFRHYAVTVDAEGLWPACEGRDARLVRWSDVVGLRERHYLQRLELLDASGKVLHKLEYQLAGFASLRQMVLERAALAVVASGTVLDLTQPLAKGAMFHAGYWLMLVVMLVGVLAVFKEKSFWLLLLPLALFQIGREYVTTVCRLQIDGDVLRVARPFRTEAIPRDEIDRIEIADQLVKGARHPEVGVFVKGREQPVRLVRLGVDATALYQALCRWKDQS